MTILKILWSTLLRSRSFTKKTIIRQSMAVPRAVDSNITRGQLSYIFYHGKHSYGLSNIRVFSWREGANLYIGSFCSIAASQKVFLGGNHRTDWASTFPFGFKSNSAFPAGQVHGITFHPSTNGHVIIENDVWIGFGCTIMSGIRISSGSVIAANSVVVKDVEPYTIVGGNPARVIRRRFPEEIVKRLIEIAWWNYSDDKINQIVPLLQQPLTPKLLDEMAALLQAKE